MLKVLPLRAHQVEALLAKVLQLKVLLVKVQVALNLVPLVVVQVLLLEKVELLHLLVDLNPEILIAEVKVHPVHLPVAIQTLVDLSLEVSQIQRIKVQAMIIPAVQRKSPPIIAAQVQVEVLADPSFQTHFFGVDPIMGEAVDFLLELC